MRCRLDNETRVCTRGMRVVLSPNGANLIFEAGAVVRGIATNRWVVVENLRREVPRIIPCKSPKLIKTARITARAIRETCWTVS